MPLSLKNFNKVRHRRVLIVETVLTVFWGWGSRVVVNKVLVGKFSASVSVIFALLVLEELGV